MLRLERTLQWKVLTENSVRGSSILVLFDDDDSNALCVSFPFYFHSHLTCTLSKRSYLERKCSKDFFFSKQSFKIAVQLDPEHSSAHLNLGVIFHLEVSNDPIECTCMVM